jgi:hypothetical protein
MVEQQQPVQPDQVRKEIERLRQTFTRTAAVALALLYFALAGLTDAMARVDGDDAARELTRVRDLDRTDLKASYVFSRQLANLPTPPVERKDPEVIREVSTRLEVLAKEWFSARFGLLGTTVSLDLRLIAPLLPLLVALVGAYLWVIHRKIGALETAHVAPAGGVVPLWNTSGFRRHPHLLVHLAVLASGAALTAWLVQMLMSLRVLVADNVQIDYVNAIVCAVAYLILYVSDATRVTSGALQAGGWTQRLRRLLSIVREKVLTTARERFPRSQLVAGAFLVLLTLILPLAKSCDEEPKKGYEYVTYDDDALWFNADFIGITDYPMRPLYGALLLVSCGALVRAVRPWRWTTVRVNSRTRWVIGFATAISRSTIVLAACSICFFLRSAPPYGDIAGVAFWAGCTFWLWQARHRPIDRARRWETIELVLLPPALTFGLQACGYLYQLRLVGVPLLMVGSLLQLRIYRLLQNADGTLSDQIRRTLQI